MIRTLLLAALATAGCATGAPLAALSAPPGPPQAFALLELFTSEGCSDTPASEALTNEIVQAARAAGKPIFALAYHVDYWDQLGWKDGYATPANTARQQAYARAIGDGRVYTPQTFVNGAKTVVGTDRGKLDGFLKDALAAAAPARVGVAAPTRAGDALQVAWTAAGAPAGATLRVALVERGIAVTPTRGENAGRALLHAPVVRAIAEADPAAGSGTASLAAPAGLAWDRASVVAFVQDPRGMAVLGAASADLQPTLAQP